MGHLDFLKESFIFFNFYFLCVNIIKDAAIVLYIFSHQNLGQYAFLWIEEEILSKKGLIFIILDKNFVKSHVDFIIFEAPTICV